MPSQSPTYVGQNNSTSTRRGMDDYTVACDGATEQTVNAEGDFFHVLSANGPVLLRFNEGRQINRSQGQGGRVIYSKVGVFSATAQTVILALGYGYATDARATVSATITAPIAPAVNNPAVASVSAAAGAQTLLMAADANMVEVGIKNPSTSVGGIFIGGNTAGLNNGYLLEPGEGIFIATQAAVYAWNNNAGAILVSMIKMSKV